MEQYETGEECRMKCYVKWPYTEKYKGPYDVDSYDKEGVDLYRYPKQFISVPRSLTIGIDDGWTVWTGGECPVAAETTVNVMFRNGIVVVGTYWNWNHTGKIGDIIAYRVVDDGWRDWIPGQGQPEETWGKRGYWESESTEVNFDSLRWDLCSISHRYKITGDAEPKTLDQAFDNCDEGMPEQVPLSTIMDRSLWWKDDENGCWYFVDGYDPGYDVDMFHLTDSNWVYRDWFTGRECKRGEEFCR
jgi:hypothetical protein